jgi:hypothetical protein
MGKNQSISKTWATVTQQLSVSNHAAVQKSRVRLQSEFASTVVLFSPKNRITHPLIGQPSNCPTPDWLQVSKPV